jgi:hypothetical protein
MMENTLSTSKHCHQVAMSIKQVFLVNNLVIEI